MWYGIFCWVYVELIPLICWSKNLWLIETTVLLPNLILSISECLSINGLSIRASHRAPHIGPYIKRIMHRIIHFITIYIFSVIFFSRCHYVWWWLLLSWRWTDIACNNFIVAICHVIIFMVLGDIGFIEITLFIILPVWWWRTISLALTKLQITFVKCTTNVRALFSWTATTTVNTTNTFLFRCTFNFNFALYFLFSLFTNIRKPENISVRVQKCEWRILFKIKEFNLQYFSIKINRPTKFIFLVLP